MQNTTCVQSSSLLIAPTLYAEPQRKSSISTPSAKPGPRPVSSPMLNIPTLQHLCLVTSIPNLPAAPYHGTTAEFYIQNSHKGRKTPPQTQGCREKPPDQGGHMDFSLRPAACTALEFHLMTRTPAARAQSEGSWPWSSLHFAPAPSTPQSRLSRPSGPARSWRLAGRSRRTALIGPWL